VRHLTGRALTLFWHGPYVLCALTAPGPPLLHPEHSWFSVAAPGRPQMIPHSILIIIDPGVFHPVVPSLSSAPGLRSFRRHISGSDDPELSRPSIFFLWLLPPDTLCWRTFILISPSQRAVCPDRSWTFSILSVRSYVMSRCPHDASYTWGELFQPCQTQTRSCARAILFFSDVTPWRLL